MKFANITPLVFVVLLFSIHYQIMAQRGINFSGYTWWVKNGTGGPGPNLWSDSDSSVWVDKSGFLHLKIRKTGNNWYCSEVNLNASLGYGSYKFIIESDLADFNKNIVAGLFLYEDDSKEIDIEFARWGNTLTVPGWYTVQPPPYTAGNQHSFDIDTGTLLSTHSFDWLPDKTYFKSIKGVEEVVPPNNNLLAEWTYTGNPQPTVGNELLHINFWLFHGNPPSDKAEAEIIIRSFNFRRANSLNEETSHLLNIFPNPAQNKIKLELKDEGNYHAEIISSTGIICDCFSFTGNTSEHDISLLPPGIYGLRIKNNKEIFSKKLIIAPR